MKENDTVYAFKLVEKKVIVKKSQVIHIKNEVKILYCVDFQFLIRMKYFFRDNVYLFIGMAFIDGGMFAFSLIFLVPVFLSVDIG